MSKIPKVTRIPDLIWDILIIAILVAGAFFRFSGLNWDQNQHLHPDERFLTMVASSIEPVKSFGEYFDTSNSTLNPNNRGYGFYVYGTLPLFIVRMAADLFNQTGYDEIFLVGRALSGLFDLLTVLLVYLIVIRLYRKKSMALLAAALTAGSVMQIQLAHYFAVDTFTTFFTTGAVYFAVRILTQKERMTIPEWITQDPDDDETDGRRTQKYLPAWLTQNWYGIIDVLWFGFFLGCAMASKINSGLVALLIPVAYGVRYANLSSDDRERRIMVYIRNIAIAAFICVLTFRVFQPYAFSGPGFFQVIPSEKWIATMKEISAQSTGDVDFPPALQWARRPLWFAPYNMILFGMGLPFGLAAFTGFGLMAWRMITANWRKHILIWGWTAIYFIWQASNWVRAMRYQVLIYPMFAIIAAWGIISLWDMGKIVIRPRRATVLRILALAAGTFAVCGTLIYAFAFSRIYTRPMTRIAASEWIYQNVPAAINLNINTGEDIFIQPLAFRGTRTITTEDPMGIKFSASTSGILSGIKLEHIIDAAHLPRVKTLQAQVTDVKGNLLTTGLIIGDFPAGNDPRGEAVTIIPDIPVTIDKGNEYHLFITTIEEGISLQTAGRISLILGDGEEISEILLPEMVDGIGPNRPYSIQFNASRAGSISEIYFPKIFDLSGTGGTFSINVSLSSTPGGEQTIGSSVVTVVIPLEKTNGTVEAVAQFDPPIQVEKSKPYTLIISGNGQVELALYGNKPALESSWDDPLPLGMNGIIPFDFNSGPYRTDLNFEMYWDDSQDKLNRFLTTINQADYIFATSNRQWGTTTRVPERYPLTAEYYRQLIGCPADRDIVWCYRVAEPGMFDGNLGFELVQVFQSDPAIGDFRVNTQFAEEAFTVYDHPKVMIFKKTDSFNMEDVTCILRAVDLSNVVHLTPRKAGSVQPDLMLPADRLSSQQAGGTWAELFSPGSWLNQYPALGAVVWYFLITLLGWITYPILRIATKTLADRGYGISKIIGLVILSYFSWLLGSTGVAFSQLNILFVLLGITIISGVLFALQLREIKSDIKDLKKLFVGVELLSLTLFLVFLGIRLGNPDLWHPYKGGEKPMDFSYFNAVLKSTSFPPYDPWFAGGYINYYYYGFVIVGAPVKLLGITPSVAYNLILPTLFSLVGTAAFSLGYTLVDSLNNPEVRYLSDRIRRRIFNTRLASEDPTVVLPSDSHDDEYPSERITFESVPIRTVENVEPDRETVRSQVNPAAILGGLASTLLLLILGNLGSLRMIWHGLIRIASPTVTLENSSYINRILWSIQGLIKMFQGAQFTYPVGDWYWIPSRTIPGEPITEFPFFTFLYADMHAHMIALPLTLAALAWAFSILLRNWVWQEKSDRISGWIQFCITLFIGALIVGALRPTNTWDLPTYLAVCSIALLVSGLTMTSANSLIQNNWKFQSKRWVEVLLGVGGFILLTFALYHPFSVWFGQGYNAIDIWKGDRTPSWSYFTHWGVFLVLIVSWLAQETYDWMASTPISALSKFKPYSGMIIVLSVLLVLIPVGLVIGGIWIAWLAFPIALWSGILLLRKNLPAAKQFIFFLIGSGMVLTLAVELIVLVGDIGRMNTVFKFYLQAWTMLAISAAFSFIMIFPRRNEWNEWLNTTWKIIVTILIFSAALFPLLAGTDKVRDRISPAAPHTLDGSAYMSTASYNDNGVIIDLSQDYEGIQWMQLNVPGSPVIVEANTVEYRWGSRYTIYTGLPGVVGWNWHQRQQRAIIPSTKITDRVEEIRQFYLTTDVEETLNFIEKYQVAYIIVGQLENLYYPGEGLEKFRDFNGVYWNTVFQNETTTIYQVRRSNGS